MQQRWIRLLLWKWNECKKITSLVIFLFFWQTSTTSPYIDISSTKIFKFFRTIISYFLLITVHFYKYIFFKKYFQKNLTSHLKFNKNLISLKIFYIIQINKILNIFSYYNNFKIIKYKWILDDTYKKSHNNL